MVLRHVSLTWLGSHAVGLCGLQGPFSTGWLTQIAASRKHSAFLCFLSCVVFYLLSNLSIGL